MDLEQKQFESLLNDARQQISVSDNSQAKQLLAQAETIPDKAKQLIQDQKFRQAIREYNNGIRLLTRALDLLTSSSEKPEDRAKLER